MPKSGTRGAEATSQENYSTKPVFSQQKIILEHMQNHGSITNMTAFSQYGITRLSGRIYDLRRMGHEIDLVWETSPKGKRYGRYLLREES